MSALSLNRVCVAGHLTRDPAVRKTNGGTAVADLGLAINESYTGRDGQAVQQVHFVDVVAWGRSATAAGEHLRKGDPLLVEGGLSCEQWQTAQGEKRTRLRVRAIRLHFVNGRRNGAPATAEAPAAEGAAPAEAPAADDPFAT
jgi:single-strand DNA-binding protein